MSEELLKRKKQTNTATQDESRFFFFLGALENKALKRKPLGLLLVLNPVALLYDGRVAVEGRAARQGLNVKRLNACCWSFSN